MWAILQPQAADRQGGHENNHCRVRCVLFRELATFESFVLNAVKLDMNQNELDVLVSLAFNIGSGTFSNFHIDKKLNAGDRSRSRSVPCLVQGRREVLNGLVTRRAAERKLFLTLGKPPSRQQLRSLKHMHRCGWRLSRSSTLSIIMDIALLFRSVSGNYATVDAGG
ncbi:lysozyme [Phyllobacterium sp. 22552]|uniref:lysozyme n=1 Tax=Phyllobacterium sp. 22552 TaxID=3453941 RepID=UPI003F84C9EB